MLLYFTQLYVFTDNFFLKKKDILDDISGNLHFKCVILTKKGEQDHKKKHFQVVKSVQSRARLIKTNDVVS